MKFSLKFVVYIAYWWCILFILAQESISNPGMKLKGRLIINGEKEELQLNCTSTQESFGKSASFMLNNITQETIYVQDDRCLHKRKGKQEECNSDLCACFPHQYSFIYKIKYPKAVKKNATYACEMWLTGIENGDSIKVIDEIYYNGTDLIEGSPKHTLIKKEVKHDKNNQTSTSDESKKSALRRMWIIIGLAAMGFLLLIGIVVVIAMIMRNKTCYKAILSIAIEMSPLINSKTPYDLNRLSLKTAYYTPVTWVCKENDA